MGEIKVTLETLYDLLRNEKKREELQKLEATFFMDALYYLKEKQVLLKSKQESTEIFASGEREKLEYELRSIRRILKELYEKREKKVLDIALNKSRTGSDLIDTGSMLVEEREFYQRILKTLDSFRRGVLLQLVNAQIPQLPDQKTLPVEDNANSSLGGETGNYKTMEQAGQAGLQHSSEKFHPPIYPPTASPTMATAQASPAMPPPRILPASSPFPAKAASQVAYPTGLGGSKTRIKFIHPMPSFIWKDMKVYGPFDAGEELEIYPEVAELIVRKGRAVKA